MQQSASFETFSILSFSDSKLAYRYQANIVRGRGRDTVHKTLKRGPDLEVSDEGESILHLSEIKVWSREMMDLTITMPNHRVRTFKQLK